MSPIPLSRRMGYRLHLDRPTPQLYTQVFQRYAEAQGAKVEPAVLERLLARYDDEGRELRCSEPRDLIERVRDVCALRRESFKLTADLLDLAWTAYFGENAR